MKGFYMSTVEGSSINLALTFGKYDVSIAADNSCRGCNNEMVRYYISVFRGSNNITYEIFTKDELISEYEACGTEENLMKAIEYCKGKSV